MTVAAASGFCLLICSIGPVQGFIGAARRTRDLWFGSHMLSELSRRVAQTVANSNGLLIFPEPKALRDGESSISNRIVAKLGTEVLVPELIEAMRLQLATGLEEFGADCLGAFGGERRAGIWIDCETFRSQLLDMFELHAAWAVATDEDHYMRAYRAASRGLAARKFTRDFPPIARASGRGGRKSSLDGVFDSVLSEAWRGEDSSARGMRRRYGIDRNEGLDAAGLIKRVLGRERPYAAISRVALQPWVEGLLERAPDRLVALEDACEALLACNLMTPARRYERLAFDAQLVLSSRQLKRQIEDSQREAAENPASGADSLVAALQELARVRSGVVTAHPLPSPYVAILRADGDRIGPRLWHAESVVEHAAISDALVEFARQARGIVAGYGGQAVYAGADEVLAFVPVPRAIECARRLADTFENLMPQNEAGALRPSMSVGVAFAHVATPMSVMRQLAQQAEALAKQGLSADDLPRKALGLVIQPRSGGAIKLRGQWDEHVAGFDTTGLDRRLAYWVEQFRSKQLPRSVASLLLDVQRQAGGQPTLLRPLLGRMLARRECPQNLRDRLDAWFNDCQTEEPLRIRVQQLLREWLAARWLASTEEGVP